MQPVRVIGIGEILWDLLPQGKMLGGAPANFSFHAQQLGAQAHVISAVGPDALGHELLQQVQHLGLPHHIATVDAPTGTVGVQLVDGQPHYTIHQPVAWDYLTLSPEASACLQQAQAVCFGSLAQRSAVSRSTIVQALELCPTDALRVFDINLRQHFYTSELLHASLERCNVLKINDDELRTIAPLFQLKGNELEQARQLFHHYQLRYLVVTRGAQGSLALDAHSVSQLAAPTVQVVDTIGAGDSFTAAFVVSLLQGRTLEQAHKRASDLAAFVCTQAGATPELPLGWDRG